MAWYPSRCEDACRCSTSVNVACARRLLQLLIANGSVEQRVEIIEEGFPQVRDEWFQRMLE